MAIAKRCSFKTVIRTYLSRRQSEWKSREVITTITIKLSPNFALDYSKGKEYF